jgi:hypothetical protein
VAVVCVLARCGRLTVQVHQHSANRTPTRLYLAALGHQLGRKPRRVLSVLNSPPSRVPLQPVFVVFALAFRVAGAPLTLVASLARPTTAVGDGAPTRTRLYLVHRADPSSRLSGSR